MKKYNIPEISNRVFAVGAKDRNRRLFDALIPLSRGTTFNSYLVKGERKTALIDTVGPGFEVELSEKLSQLMELSSLDYIVMNHAEPDHGSALPKMMGESAATLVTSEKGAAMATRFYGISPERIQTITGGSSLDLGGKTLNFLSAPWLHWPETMFTYLLENKLLFSCDFFGAHAPDGSYDDEIPDIISLAKGYFGEIMMPFRSFCKRGLDNIAGLDIEMIAPSHGPVYRNPKRIIEVYRKWVAGETELKAIILYATMWNSTELIVNSMIECLLGEGISVKPYNLAQFDMSLLAEDLVDSRAIVIGSPTVLSGLHPLVVNALNLIKLLKPPLIYGVILNSYGWSKGALKQGLEFFDGIKVESVGAVEIYGPPAEEDYIKIAEAGHLLASKMRAL